MMEIAQEYERPPVRPTFITVLCILTFIGSGWRVVSESMTYFTADTQAAAISVAKEKVNTDLEKEKRSDEGTEFAKKMVNSLNTSPEKIKNGALSNTGAAILCLVGAVLMWQLKRTGFYIYVAGTLMGIVSPFVIFGAGNMIAVIWSVVVGFIGLIFVILYGVNLKYMR